MKIFEHPNFSNKEVCLVCKKADDKPVTLIGIIGTEDEGNIQAKQVHIDCLELYVILERKIIAMRYE